MDDASLCCMSDVLSGIDFAAPGEAIPHLRSPSRRRLATWADVGLHRLCAALWLLNGAMFVSELVLFRVTGLHLAWSSSLSNLAALVAAGVVWGYFAWQPGKPREWIV